MKSSINKNNCYFTNSIVADLIFIIMNVFNKESAPFTYYDIYKEDYIQKIKGTYRFLDEIICSLPAGGSEMLEFLLHNKDFNDITAFQNYISNMDDADFFYTLYGELIDKDSWAAALKNDTSLSELYSKYNNLSTSYVYFRSLLKNKELFLKEFFTCLESLNTEEFSENYQAKIAKINLQFENLDNQLLSTEPLELSQLIMGKTFRNVGPYENFIFIPSYYIPRKATRYFGKDQILIYSPDYKQDFSKAEIINILKVISDETRFEIIELLSSNNSMIGKDLASSLKLSTPTVSHHIEQLKKAGFINEERIKNSKFYSINHNSVNKFIDYLTERLKR